MDEELLAALFVPAIEKIATSIDNLAGAVRAVGISPNVMDSNGEAANLVDTTERIGWVFGRLLEAMYPEPRR